MASLVGNASKRCNSEKLQRSEALSTTLLNILCVRIVFCPQFQFSILK